MKFVLKNKTKTHCEMLIIICKQLSNFYLDEFNLVKKTGIFPAHYLNKRDAMRELQYLCEYWKIREFELQGDPARTW